MIIVRDAVPLCGAESSTPRTRSQSISRSILAALVFVVSGLAITSTVASPSARAAAAPPATTRADITVRANEWYLKSTGQVPGIPAGAPQPGFGRDPNLEFDGTRLYPGWQEPAMGWRTDCSGLVLYAWGLDRSHRESSELIGPAFGVQIPFADLAQGDVLGTIENGHITLFDRWIDRASWTYLAYDFGGGATLDLPMTHEQRTLRDISSDGISQARRNNDDRHYRAYRHSNLVNPTLPPATGTLGSFTAVNSRLHITGTVAIAGFSGPIAVNVRFNGGAELLTYSSAGSASRPFSARVPGATYLGGQACVQAVSGSHRTDLGCRSYPKPPVTGTVNPQFTTDSQGWIYLTGTANLLGFDGQLMLTGTVNGSATPYWVYSNAGAGPRAFRLLAAKDPASRHGAVFCVYGENTGTKTKIGCATYP
jgi:hypothetical protein